MTATEASRAAELVEDGAELLDDVALFVERYVACPDHALVTITLWAAHAHALDAFENTPRLALLSPEPGSGKTRTLEVLDLLVPRPMHALSASAAPIFRSIEKDRPTLLFDEVDALFGRRGKDDSAEDMRALLNAGHRRGASIPRCVGPTHAVAHFPVFAAVALAGLGDLPDTLMSRSVIIRMRRRAPGEHVEPFRHRTAAPTGYQFRDRLAQWVEQARDDLHDAWPTMPPGITDRPADVWEPLLAIADAAGGDWPHRARAACLELARVAETREASLGVRLLTDLRLVFGDDEALATETILERLHAIDEAPWADLRGRPLDARGLAYRLRQYGITSTKVKIGDKSVRGYRAHATPEHAGPDLYDAWTRYLAPTSGEAEPTEPGEPGRSEALRPVPDNRQVPEPAPEAEPPTGPLTCDVPQVPQVPLPAGETPPEPEPGDSEPVDWHGTEDGHLRAERAELHAIEDDQAEHVTSLFVEHFGAELVEEAT